MNAGISSANLVQLAYRPLRRYAYYDKMDLFLRTNVTARDRLLIQNRQERDCATIIAVTRKIPAGILQEDPKLLMWYDKAVARKGD